MYKNERRSVVYLCGSRVNENIKELAVCSSCCCAERYQLITACVQAIPQAVGLALFIHPISSLGMVK